MENQGEHGKPWKNRENMENQDKHGKPEGMENQEGHGKTRENKEKKENMEYCGEHGKPRKLRKNKENRKNRESMENQRECGILLRLQGVTFPHGKSQIPVQAGAASIASEPAQGCSKVFLGFGISPWPRGHSGDIQGQSATGSGKREVMERDRLSPFQGVPGTSQVATRAGKNKEFWQREAGNGGNGEDFRESGNVERDGKAAGNVGVAVGWGRWTSPGDLLEFSWKSPGSLLELSWNSPEGLLEFQSSPGDLLEFQS